MCLCAVLGADVGKVVGMDAGEKCPHPWSSVAQEQAPRARLRALSKAGATWTGPFAREAGDRANSL